MGASATATVTLQMTNLADSNWGDATSIGQILREAEREAKNQIETAIRANAYIRIIDVKVSAVIVPNIR